MGYTPGAGPKGLGTFTNSAQTVSDLNKMVELVARVGNVRVGTTAERDALSAAELYAGMHFYDNTLKRMMKYTGTGWGEAVDVTNWLGVTAADGSWNVSQQFGYRGVSMRQVGREVWIEGIFSRSTGFEAGFFMGSTPAGITPPSQKTPLLCLANGVAIEMSIGDDAGNNLNRFRMGKTLAGNQTCIVTGHYFTY